MKLATIVNFCTHDFRFFKKSIEAVSSFSDQVIVPICDHFFNGELENLALIEKIYRDYPHVDFIEFAYDPEQLYGTFKHLLPESPEWGPQWHNSSRLVAFYFLKECIDSVLFCDVDEVVDQKKFTEWLKNFDLTSYSALRFSTYWYFREASFQATTYPDGPLLVKKEALTSELILNEDERMGLFLRIQGKKERLFPGLDGRPMVHHYSWVRTREELLKKVTAWAHHWERDWKALIEEEYSREFQGNDFVRKYAYQKVDPFFDPLVDEVPHYASISLEQHSENIKKFPHVRRVSAKEIFRKQLLSNLK
ncbi:MAG TPA: hypothetical protein VLG76_02910 [Rhabdochlamydiaceae bacterium]|nr:hypothetical protein [Rhabdochlamydiaceae bacterium]